jgi:hypothetical protein
VQQLIDGILRRKFEKLTSVAARCQLAPFTLNGRRQDVGAFRQHWQTVIPTKTKERSKRLSLSRDILILSLDVTKIQ